MSTKASVISIINHKGGTAKTTSAVHLAAALAKKGKRVLAIDLDTQTNMTHWLIGDLPEGELSIAECVLDKTKSLKKVIKPTKIDNLDLAPAGESMVDLELRLASSIGRETLMKQALESIKGSYDYIILDNPPNIGLTTINALVASDHFIVPVSCEYLPMVGIKHLLKTIAVIQPLNEKLRNLGYLLTMVDRREGITSDVEEILRKNFPNQVFKNVIRINTKLKACPQKRATIFDIESSSGRGYQDYMNVGKEFLKRMEETSGHK
jgi:chromosome partitioning protein